MKMIPLVKAIEQGEVRSGNRVVARLVDHRATPAPPMLQADLREGDREGDGPVRTSIGADGVFFRSRVLWKWSAKREVFFSQG